MTADDGAAQDTREPLRPDALRERLVTPAGPVHRLEVVERTGSTNTDLADALRADPAAWGDVGVLVTEHQVDGRGRSGRSWQTPAAAALTFSIALRPPAPAQSVGWLPLLAGLAVVRAVRPLTDVPVSLKWPNDLLVDAPGAAELDGWGTHRKVGGILAELVPATASPVVVVGIGLNVSQTAAELPVPSALSLAGAGASGAALDRGGLLVAIVGELAGLVERWQRSGGDVRAAGLADDVAAVCTTLGLPVRVELPGDQELRGTAVELAPDGALLVRDEQGQVHPVRAGDVRHVRTGGGPG
ncbi:biotin--[acetyl-CoA-carboxylase] ligase [Cellulomonas aerilata]|uniref:biotin--[biotin carboxyl-carrier protein] ligase n=1 Tax=Cellulomonas aerilata TaxID=515326 RepID=A0A512DE67_9CELL|nr:biotin--[acetyl-CoA-carboxylase] ligase [Cellulomonas aerilata]GEO34759.1 biotin--[acetyl-CoA-carboxylase] ligase [Cellulomonas aerilata]